MYPTGAAAEIVVLFLVAWLLVLSFLFWREKNFLHKLFPKSQERDIRNKFNEVLEAIESFGKKGEVLNNNFKKLSREGLDYIQRVEVLRYNPYKDTGGDQSFSIVLLNGKMDGFVLTSLHSRAGTRVYTKPIKNGQGELELSKEEAEVVKKAIALN